MNDRTKDKHDPFYCYRCLHAFIRRDLLEEHTQYCKAHTVQKIKMPRPEKKIMEFGKQHCQHPVPFIIYADFESILAPFYSLTPGPVFLTATIHNIIKPVVMRSSSWDQIGDATSPFNVTKAEKQ